jgi:uncharacterized protein YprB with RNaseH-like and TPR domain
MTHLIFFDLETTGLIAGQHQGQHQICQFHAKVLRTEDHEVVHTLDRKVQIVEAWADPKALAINGYDKQVWDREAIPQDQLRDTVRNLLEGYRDVSLRSKVGATYRVAQLVGWNSEGFDMKFLRELFGTQFMPARMQSLDVMQIALAYEARKGQCFRDLKLRTVHETLFPGRQSVWHEAGADVQATIDVWKELSKW